MGIINGLGSFSEQEACVCACLDGLSIPLYQLAWEPEETNIKGSTDRGKHRGKTREAMIEEGQKEAREGRLWKGKTQGKQGKEATLYLGHKLEQMIYRDSISHRASIAAPANIFNSIIVAPRI